jgi:hypothetical protein
MTETVPDELRTDDRHDADGKAILDMGYRIEYEKENSTTWVTIRPGDLMADDTLVEEFVCRIMENLGFRRVEVVGGKAVFSRVEVDP